MLADTRKQLGFLKVDFTHSTFAKIAFMSIKIITFSFLHTYISHNDEGKNQK